ncbi:hypothetical protein [Desulfoferrobacter suflitae]|uniref:hypothetical protein n=1 Tax=Desulfoferrobacter suflitae TaxID=2865782 RepID=UPI0021640FBD|nr:hypothetical protein [Desulfoferrobacter suflitae]MCK8601145.1 hypothetical protein [Desulfoferrobacter suflitae]
MSGRSIEQRTFTDFDSPPSWIPGFRFPLCSEFQTATNPKTNLARCFRCQKNFNPIDIVMAVNCCNFREAVEMIDGLQDC